MSFKKRKIGSRREFKKAIDSIFEEPQENSEVGNVRSEEMPKEEKLSISEIRLLQEFRGQKLGVSTLLGSHSGHLEQDSSNVDETGDTSLSAYPNVVAGGKKDQKNLKNEGKMTTIRTSDSFTHQTNIVDVDKHMLEFIERKMLEIKSKKAPDEDQAHLDGDETSKKLSEINKNEKIREKDQSSKSEREKNTEGNILISASMLTSVPEVDIDSL
ncbi:hypothetical protein AX774_g1605 [Zancudomyces culisetae]|nr:hypothetical protein AX774_g1605 [Zancudomyces culisetae]|eukprot:OMH84872.1 hypothetical protein AX774_g1605 [Zancudomyces culisetae]